MDGARYQKEGDAGSKGIDFQVNLLTIFLLNALQRFKDWRLSTENKRAGKFDDVVLEYPEGAVLLQAKHKKKKKITVEELLSTNSKSDDFSLPKYFLSYQEIKHEFKGHNTLIICTNADVHEKALEFLDSRRISSESMLYWANENYSFYIPNTNILPQLKQGIEEYLEKNNRNKTIDRSVITDENISHFLNHLQIFAKFPSDNCLEIAIEQLLSAMKRCNNLYEKRFSLELRSKMTDWFQHKDGVYLTVVRAKAMFCELRTEKYWQTLDQYEVEFRRNDLQFPESKRIYHMVVENGYLLQVIKIHHALMNRQTKFLSINPDDDIDIQRQVVEAFQLPQYTYLIIIWVKSTEKSVMTEITERLSATLTTHQHKKIVLVTDSGDELNELFGLSENDLDINFGSATFKDLSEETREKLLNKKNIIFQERCISLNELFPIGDSEDLEKAVDLSLHRLVGEEKIIIGEPILYLNQSLNSLYINRTFKRQIGKWMDEEIKVVYSEEDIYDVPEKMIVISDKAGMGKTTVLTNLAAIIKENHPLLWVIKIELNDFSAILKDFLKNKRKTINVLDLLQYKNVTTPTNELDSFIFGMEEKVVLMLDGVDEISPDYTDLVINLLVQCQEATNFAKVFVTTRPHVVPKLQEKLQVTLFTLEPFAEENQIHFLTRYWTNSLILRDDSNRIKCTKYARALVNKMSLTDLNNGVEDYFTAIPLQLRMLAEIFQESIVSDESLDWEGCREYLHTDREDPRLPDTMDLVKLYDMFIDKKRDIFIDKENPNGHTAATRALKDQFEECLHFHRDVALNIVLRDKERYLFSSYSVNRDMEDVALKIGIVQELYYKFDFIHRTLAEYFVAQSIVRELQCQNQNREFEKFLIEEVFYTNTYNTVLAFFDNFLQKIIDSIPTTIFQEYHSFTSYKHRSMFKYKVDIIHRLAEKGFVGVIKLILNCIDFTIVRNKQGEDIYELFDIDDVENPNTLTCLESILKPVGLNLKDYIGKTPLHFAASKGHFKVVKFLVDHGATVNSIDKYYHSPLVEAAQNGYTDITKYLLVQALGVETSQAFKANDSDVETFLLETVLDNSRLNIENTMVPYVAACMGLVVVLQASIERGINVDGKFENGETLIFGAARGSQLSTIEYLVKKDANINSRDDRGRTALHLIAQEDTAKSTAELLIRLGIDIHITDDSGNTALHIAASKDNFHMAHLLLESGAKVNCRDTLDRTALHNAAYYGAWSCVKLLTNNGANVNMIDQSGNTALHLCIDNWEALETVKFLVQQGADVAIKNNEGLTAFLVAAVEGNEDIIEYLVELGTDVNATDSRGYNALHLVVENDLNNGDVSSTYDEFEYEDNWENENEYASLKFLLGHGANINATDKTGRTVLHLAVEKQHLHAIELFMEAGSDVNAKDKKGWTPLHLAVVDYHEDVVKFLIDKGADLEARDNKRRTPYDLAKKDGNSFPLQYLKKKDAKSKPSCIRIFSLGCIK